MTIEKARKQVKSAFFITTLIGIVIVFMFLASDEDKYSVLIMLIPMAGYIIYGNQIASKHRYMPEFADSVYYLGFTFTLLSLLGATIFEKLSADPEKTISYFGMALATTILGLMYRNYHMQFTDLNVDPLKKAKQDLQDEVDNFILSSESINEVMELIKQKYEDAADMLTRLMPEQIESSIKSIDTQIASSLQSLEQNLQSLDEVYAEILEKTRSKYEGLDSVSSKALKNTLRMFGEMSEKIRYTTNRVVTAIEASADQTEKLKSNLESFNNSILNQDSGKGILDDSLSSIEKASKELQAFSKSTTSLNTTYMDNVKSLEAISGIITKEIAQIEKIFSDVEKLIKKKFE